MKTKRYIPTYFYKQSIQQKFVFNSIHYDFLTNYFCNLKQNNQIIYQEDLIYKNKLLKIHDFRYKA